MIDAAWVLGGGDVDGNTGSSNYTTVAWVTGAGKGATFTPAKGDAGKTLFVPNAGNRYLIFAPSHGAGCYVHSTTAGTNASEYILFFYGDKTSGGMMSGANQLEAKSLRCVRS